MVIDVVLNAEQLNVEGEKAPLAKMRKNLIFLTFAGALLWLGPDIIAQILGEPSFEAFVVPPSWKDEIYCGDLVPECPVEDTECSSDTILAEWIYTENMCICEPDCGDMSLSKDDKEHKFNEYKNEVTSLGGFGVNLHSMVTWMLWGGRALVVIGLLWFTVRL